MTPFFVGLDLGKVNDPMALVAVKERQEFSPPHYEVCGVRRKLGLNYDKATDDVAEMLKSPALSACTLCMDILGPGHPTADMLRAKVRAWSHPEDAAALGSLGVKGLQPGPKLVLIAATGGKSVNVAQDKNSINVPKRDLCSVPLLLMAQYRLLLPKTCPNIGLLITDLENLRVEIVESAKTGKPAEHFYNEGAGHHDLVMGLSMALWSAVYLPRPDTGPLAVDQKTRREMWEQEQKDRKADEERLRERGLARPAVEVREYGRGEIVRIGDVDVVFPD